MAQCKFCLKTIIWKRLDGRWVPHNTGGTRHTCVSDSAVIRKPIETFEEPPPSIETRLHQLAETLDSMVSIILAIMIRSGITPDEIEETIQEIKDGKHAVVTLSSPTTSSVTEVLTATAALGIITKPSPVAEPPGALLPPEVASEFMKTAGLTDLPPKLPPKLHKAAKDIVKRSKKSTPEAKDNDFDPPPGELKP